MAQKFFDDLCAIWEEQGEAILRRAAFEDPMKFAQMVAKLMPQKIEVKDTTMDDLDDERLFALLSFLQHRGETPSGGAA